MSEPAPFTPREVIEKIVARHKADVLDLLASGDEARAMFATCEAERDRYRAALELITETVGHGAPDIIVANTMLGRIHSLATKALSGNSRDLSDG